MTKLLSAGHERLFKSRVFRLCLAAAVIMPVLMVLGLYRDGSVPENGMEQILFNCLPYMSFFCAVFVSLLFGAEHGDGVLRNKIIVGHGRTALYLSELLLAVGAAAILFVLNFAAVWLAALWFFESPALSAGEIAWYFLCSVLACGAWAALCLAVTAMCGSKAGASVLCIVMVLLLIIGCSYVGGRLSEGEVIHEYILVNEFGQPLQVEEQPNPRYIGGFSRQALEFLYDMLPAGQSIQISNLEVERPERLPLMSLLCLALSSGLGLAVFKKKDLK